MNLGELWLPRTDAGVVAEVVITVALIAALAWAFRRERSVVLLVFGVGAVALAWYGLRALH